MDTIDKELIRRWLNNHCTAPEIAGIKRCLEVKGAGHLSQQMEEDWERTRGTMQVPDTERLLANIRSTIKLSEIKEAPVLPLPIRRKMAIAAAILIISLTGLGTWRYYHVTRTKGLTWDIVRNQQKYKMNISLPDHSQVWLEPGSVLKIATDFGKADRRVQLIGEAYFDVAKDPSHPFTVQTEKMITHVLGTQFNIEAYGTEPLTRISLVEGKVTATFVRTGNQPGTVTLSPGNRWSYNPTEGSERMESSGLSTPDFTGSSLVLQGIPLSTALYRIGMHYGMNVRLQGKLQEKQQLSAIVPGNDLVAALNNLAFVYQLHYRIERDTIYLYKN